MRLEFIGKDPESTGTQSPTLYRTDRGSYIVQGWTVDDAEALATLDLPEGEAAVEIPARLIPLFKDL